MNDPLWSAIQAHLEKDLERLRAKNDGPLSELETAALRGRIAAVKDLLALPARLAAEAEQHDPDY